MDSLSLWIDNAGKGPQFTNLKGEYEADIVIVGAGITGLTAGLRLAHANKRVIILEAYTVGSGTTGHSSCHLNTSIEEGYTQIVKDFGLETGKIVAESRKEAINFIETICKIYNIDADFRRLPGYIYAEDQSSVNWLLNESRQAKECGIEAEFLAKSPLDIKTFGALKFNEAEFDSQKYLLGLVKVIKEKGGQIFENSPVTDITESKGVFTVTTNEGSIKAKEVIQATHYPLFVNVLQTLAHAYRSYLIAYKLNGDFPKGLFYNTDDPYYYIRTIEDKDGTILLAGGADHKTGTETDTEKCYQDIDKYVRERFPVGEIISKWSSQYYEPSDGLPYIGENPVGVRTYVATGYAGIGLVYGTVAGIILSDILSGVENSWIKVYNSKRFTPVASASEFVKENVDVAVHFVKDRFQTSDKDFSDIAPGEGKIMELNGEKIAVARDKYNEIHLLSPVCTHMKCFVQWNKSEQSWDCPCHGSRFGVDGKVLTGPAVSELEKRMFNTTDVFNNKK